MKQKDIIEKLANGEYFNLFRAMLKYNERTLNRIKYLDGVDAGCNRKLQDI
jgi:hypothetical protein